MAFPPGFTMIAGDATRRNASVHTPDIPQSLWGPEDKKPKALAQKAVGFTCLNYSGHSEGALTRHMLPTKGFIDSNCADGLRLELMFPSCWNGVSISADDYKSHVAYPDLVMEGKCPEHYDTRIPALFYETIWDTAVFRNVPGHFLLSNGDQTGKSIRFLRAFPYLVSGSSYHGDFQNGWDIDVLQQAIDSCTNPSGLIEDCSIFSLQSPTQASQCVLLPPAAVANESCLGPQPSLCGNITL
jgi:hypothetical protein